MGEEADDDEDDGADEGEDDALDASDFGNIWEGMLEKQGKYMLNKSFKQRWCSIKGSRFEYFEDHLKKKSLGVVPLEMCTWTEVAPEGKRKEAVVEMHTIGRASKAGEDGGRTFFFRFLGDSDKTGFFASLARAAYLRNREVFLDACRRGDAFTLHQVLLRLRTMEGSEMATAAVGGMGIAVMSGGSMAVCQPVSFVSDFDPAAGLADAAASDYELASGLAAAAALGTPGVVSPAALDLLLHESHANSTEHCSALHLAVRSLGELPWGDEKQRETAAAAAVAGVEFNISALAGHGPHPLACVRLLLSPLWSEDAEASGLLRTSSEFSVPPPCRFLLETIDNNGDTPLHAALKSVPFRERVDVAAAARHAALRSSASDQRPLYELDPLTMLKSSGIDFGSGGLAIAMVLLNAGARPAAVNDRGMNALHVASSTPEHLAIIRGLLVMSGGSDINAQDAVGLSPLMHAAVENNCAGVEALLSLKADLTAASWKNGYTALSWAVRSASDAVVHLILDEEMRQRVLSSAPVLLMAPPPPKLDSGGGVDESTWLDAADAAFMASAPKPPKPAGNYDDGDEEEEGDPGASIALPLKRPLVEIADSRGDMPIHILARAYVAKSREQQRMKNATLAQYKSILSALLDQDGVNVRPAIAPHAGGALRCRQRAVSTADYLRASVCAPTSPARVH